jgi:protein-S-isoprenylcysteine O-methyltransferase Ste14
MRPIDRAAANPHRRALLTLLAPVVMGSILATGVFLSLLLDRHLGLPRLPGEPLRIVIGIPLVAGGASLAGVSASRFFRVRGTPVPFNPPQELVVAGPYRWTRNPMMAGLLTALLGVAFLLRSAALAAIVLPTLALIMYLVVRFVEEPELELRFGEAYRRYRAVTPRFVPRLRAGSQRADYHGGPGPR